MLFCVCRPDGAEVLASYSSDYLYIFDPKEDETKGRKLKVSNFFLPLHMNTQKCRPRN